MPHNASCPSCHCHTGRGRCDPLTDLLSRFDAVLGERESVAGWKTARHQRPVQILGKLEGIETGIRRLIRNARLKEQRHAGLP